MDAFRQETIHLKSDDDLVRGLIWYLAQPMLTKQDDVDRLIRITKELGKRSVDTRVM